MTDRGGVVARTVRRGEQWESVSQRNNDIKRRFRAGQPAEQIAHHYGLSAAFVQRIVGAFE